MPAEQFNTFVSGLPVAAPLVGSEPIPVIQGGVTKQTTPQALVAQSGAVVYRYQGHGGPGTSPRSSFSLRSADGLYYLFICIVTTVADPAASNNVQATLTFDQVNVGATADNSSTDLTLLGAPAINGVYILFTGGQPVTYEVNDIGGGGYGTAEYDLYVAVVKLS